tara:strand:- start:123 stop:230 length:108 start_codon:yes stop_codon:yes gene_type:complete
MVNPRPKSSIPKSGMMTARARALPDINTGFLMGAK